MLQMLKDINERTIERAKGQDEIKSNQHARDAKLSDVFSRLESLERKSDALDELACDVGEVKETAERLSSQ